MALPSYLLKTVKDKGEMKNGRIQANTKRIKQKSGIPKSRMLDGKQKTRFFRIPCAKG